MDFSTIKMVVTDMDGTLLNEKHEVSTEFFELFQKMQQRGIRFVAASGRQYPSMVSKLEPIKDQMSFISENGALIVENDTVIHSRGIEMNQVTELLEYLGDESAIQSIICCAEKAYSTSKNQDFHQLLHEYYSSHVLIDHPGQVRHEPLKIALYHPISGEQHIYPSVQHYSKHLQVKISGDYWVDLSHKDANKGVALTRLLEQYQIKPDEIIVFGDYLNDLEMLQLTPNSVAMGNAHEQVKKLAKYQTTSHQNLGVEKILSQLLTF